MLAQNVEVVSHLHHSVHEVLVAPDVQFLLDSQHLLGQSRILRIHFKAVIKDFDSFLVESRIDVLLAALALKLELKDEDLELSVDVEVIEMDERVQHFVDLHLTQFLVDLLDGLL